MAKAKTKNQHVIPYGDKWAVRGEGNDLRSRLYALAALRWLCALRWG